MSSKATGEFDTVFEMSSKATGEFDTVFDDFTSINFLWVQEGVSLGSNLLIISLLVWTCVAFGNEKHYSLRISIKMKTVCLISIVSYLLMSIISAVCLNDFIVSITKRFCKYSYISYLVTYAIGNIFMYYTISYHIGSIFPSHVNKLLAMSDNLLIVYRVLGLILPSVLWGFYLYFAFDHINVIEVEQYKYCFAKQFMYPFWAQSILIFIAIFHIIFILFMLFIIIHKSINNSTIIIKAITSKKHRFIKQLSKFIRKTTILCIVTIISTVILLCCSAFILQQLLFFLVLDGVINAYCVVCLLDIGDGLYIKTWGKFEKLCECLYCLDIYLSQKLVWRQFEKFSSNKYKHKNKGYKPPTLIDSETGFLLANSITINGDESKSVTPMSGFTNITQWTPQDLLDDDNKEDSLIILNTTDSTLMFTELQLQSTAT
eukprot:432870_1